MSHIEKTIKFNWNYTVISKCSCVGIEQNKKIYQSMNSPEVPAGWKNNFCKCRGAGSQKQCAKPNHSVRAESVLPSNYSSKEMIVT